MFRGRFLGALLALLLIIGLLGLAGSSIYRAGWTQGYFVGKVSDGAGTVVVPEAGGPEAGVPESAAPAAGVPYNGPWQAPGFSRGGSTFGWFLGGMVKFFLVLLAIGFVFKLFFGMLFWRKRGHWGKGYGWGHGRHHGWGHDHRPPWHDESADEPIMKA